MRYVILVVLALSLGCSMQWTGHGPQATFGNSSATTCGEIPEPVDGEEAQAVPDCSTTVGGAISETGASILAPLFGILGRIGGILTGIPAVQ